MKLDIERLKEVSQDYQDSARHLDATRAILRRQKEGTQAFARANLRHIRAEKDYDAIRKSRDYNAGEQLDAILSRLEKLEAVAEAAREAYGEADDLRELPSVEVLGRALAALEGE
jgi:hypothetical protein